MPPLLMIASMSAGPPMSGYEVSHLQGLAQKFSSPLTLLDYGEKDRDPPIFTLVIAALPLSAHRIDIFQSLPLMRIIDLTLNRIERDSEASAWSRIIPHLVWLKRFTVYKVLALSLLGAAPELFSYGGIDTNHNPITNVHNPELDTVNMDDVSLVH